MWDKVGPKNWRRPLLLRPDNFTPPARTPWGGRRIVGELKAEFDLPTEGPVGEAWELSVEPDFPSRLVEGSMLDAVLRSDAPALLGREAALGSTALLVKLVDAADDLSVQIHPEDGDPRLDETESGKPEAWYIIDADAGSGLYLGLRDGVSRQDIEEAIDQEADVSALLTFVPVVPGDVFIIEPGTPHAIGKGVMLLEPQRVSPGKRGITYRYWDWNRRYDAEGRPDPDGRPRKLHLERALDVTRWQDLRGNSLVDRIRHRAGAPATDAQLHLQSLAGPGAPLRSDVFEIQRLTGTGDTTLAPTDRIRAVTVLAGRLTVRHEETTLTVQRGQTAALPACLGPVRVEVERAHVMVCSLA